MINIPKAVCDVYQLTKQEPHKNNSSTCGTVGTGRSNYQEYFLLLSGIFASLWNICFFLEE
jgi:hypothetical protein